MTRRADVWCEIFKAAELALMDFKKFAAMLLLQNLPKLLQTWNKPKTACTEAGKNAP